MVRGVWFDKSLNVGIIVRKDLGLVQSRVDGEGEKYELDGRLQVFLWVSYKI